MGIKAWGAAVLLSFPFVGVFSDLHAMTITVDFGNECQAVSGAGPVFKITGPSGTPFPCGDYTIEKRPGAGDEARVDTGNDGSVDTLMLLDAKFTKRANSTHPDLHITITASNYQALPSSVLTQTDPPVSYQWSGTGKFLRNNNVLTPARGSSIIDRGWSQSDASNPANGTPQQAGNTLTFVICDSSGQPAGCVNTNSFSPSAPAGNPHTTFMNPPYNANPLMLNNLRLLKGELTVRLISTTSPAIADQLQLTNLTLTDIPGGCTPKAGKPCKPAGGCKSKSGKPCK
jgi:hypothetical protein